MNSFHIYLMLHRVRTVMENLEKMFISRPGKVLEK